jgi:hypothetical protein
VFEDIKDESDSFSENDESITDHINNDGERQEFMLERARKMSDQEY